MPDGYESWLDWWRDNALDGIEAIECQCHDCHETGKLEGAYVYYDDHPDGDIYVIPLCFTYNHFTNVKVMQIDEPKYLVRVPRELLVEE